jgi:hypothetical protein
MPFTCVQNKTGDSWDVCTKKCINPTFSNYGPWLASKTSYKTWTFVRFNTAETKPEILSIDKTKIFQPKLNEKQKKQILSILNRTLIPSYAEVEKIVKKQPLGSLFEANPDKLKGKIPNKLFQAIQLFSNQTKIPGFSPGYAKRMYNDDGPWIIYKPSNPQELSFPVDIKTLGNPNDLFAVGRYNLKTKNFDVIGMKTIFTMVVPYAMYLLNLDNYSKLNALQQTNDQDIQNVLKTFPHSIAPEIVTFDAFKKSPWSKELQPLEDACACVKESYS